jgi:predicted MFS family arabinose efflux permease
LDSALSSKKATSDLIVTLAVTGHFLMNATIINVYPALAATVTKELNLSGTEMGLLMSVTSIAYALIQIPVGILGTRYHRGVLLTVSALVMAIGCFLFAAVPQYGWMLFARVLMGLGAGFSVPIAMHLLADVVPEKKLGRSLGIFGTGWGAGAIIAFFGVSTVNSAVGWRWAAVATGVMACLIAVELAVFLKGRVPAARHADASIWSGPNLVKLALNRNLFFLMLINLSAITTSVGVATWVPSFLESRLESGVFLSNAMTGILGISWLLSSIFGGELLARLGKRFVILSSMIALVILPVTFVFVNSVAAALIILVLVGWFTMFYFSAVFSSIPGVVPAGQSGAATGVFNCFTWAGPFLSPLLFGLAMDVSHQYLYGFMVLSAIPLVGVFGTIGIWKSIGPESEAVPAQA